MRPNDKVPFDWASSKDKETMIGFFIFEIAPTEPKPVLSMILESHSIFSSNVRFEPTPAFVKGLFLL